MFFHTRAVLRNKVIISISDPVATHWLRGIEVDLPGRHSVSELGAQELNWGWRFVSSPFNVCVYLEIFVLD